MVITMFKIKGNALDAVISWNSKIAQFVSHNIS